jgi:hypothetical protein
MESLNLQQLVVPSGTYVVGGGGVSAAPGGAVRLAVGPVTDDRYADAQLDDYHVDGRMRWRPPLRLTVRARFSHKQARLAGTAGFGFWNDPFGMTGRARLRLPQVIWFFFGGQKTDLPLRRGVSGNGWKAATLDASRPITATLLPAAPVAALLMRSEWAYRRLWPAAERLLRVDEAKLDTAMDAWHNYTLEWRRDGAVFRVDGAPLLATRRSPRGPLGLVVWIDNQYMVVRPQGRFRHGTVAIDRQWLEVATLDVRPTE